MWMWSQGRTSSTGRCAGSRRDIDPQIGKGLPPDRARNTRTSRRAGPAPPGFLQRGSDPAVAARQDALEQAALDVMQLHLHGPQLDPVPQVPVGPVEIVAVCMPFH